MSGKILIADDQQEIVSALSMVLAGYELEEANDGNAALSLAVSEQPDLVLLDVDMPGMSGIEVLKKLMTRPRHPLVIMLTAEGSPETVSKVMQAGVFAYIIKPFEKAEVLEQVQRAFKFMESSRS